MFRALRILLQKLDPYVLLFFLVEWREGGEGTRREGGGGGTTRKHGPTRCMTKSHVTGPFGTAVVVGGEKVTVVLQGWLYSSPGTGGDSVRQL